VLACRLLKLFAQNEKKWQFDANREARLQYTIESRPLTNEYTHRASADAESRQTTIEAASADDAISKFLHQSASELVSVTRPLKGRESIATVKKDEYVFLVRVYAA
jgi:hypothetical protein